LKRWKEADLVLEDGAALDELLDCGEYMSSLESLRVSTPEIFVKNYDAFEVAPHLTKLDLVHGGFAAAWEFPWAQLTKLRIETPCDSFKTYYANSNLWGVLSELENIEELHIIIETFSYPELPSSLAIKRLPSLRLLEITLGFAIMFSWLTAPLLEHLYIRGCNICSACPPLHNHQPYERQLTSLTQPLYCHIRRLTLERCRPKEMRIILKALASVEELSINYPRHLDVIEDITGVDGYICLPKLRVLRVAWIKSSWITLMNAMRIFSRLLEARGNELSCASHNIVPLEKFVLRLNLEGECSGTVLKFETHGWPPFAQVYISDRLHPFDCNDER
jgi:hypothetical protein